jgi:hypothetical protein
MLQSLFPETRHNDDYQTVRGWTSRLEREAHELGLVATGTHDPNSLYEMMLASVIKRTSNETKTRSKATFEAVNRLLANLNPVFSLDVLVERPGDEQLPPAAPDEPVGARTLLRALEPSTSAECHRFPLVPVEPVRRGSGWAAVLDSTLTPRSVEEWRSTVPSLAVVLYPLKRLPPDGVRFNPFSVRIGMESI